MAADDKIELIIEGLPEDEGRVRLSAFLFQLQKLSAALSKFDRESNDGKPASIFEISSISSNSPVSVILEPRPIASQRFVAGAIIERFKYVVDALNSENDLSSFDADLLDDIRALAKPVGRTLRTATIYFNGTDLKLNSYITERVDKALAIEDECDGSIEGMLEQINVHQGANTFHIYPEVGPKKVICHFPATLLDDAVAAVGRKVEVFGNLKYRARASFAHQIVVKSLEAFSPDYDLPNWDDLRGRAPDATGALSSEDFVRELRDAW